VTPGQMTGSSARYRLRALVATIAGLSLVAGLLAAITISRAGEAAAANTELTISGESGGSTTEPAKRGANVSWTTTGDPAASPAQGTIQNTFAGPQSYKSGPLQVPPGWTKQYSTDGGNTWVTDEPGSGVTDVRAVPPSGGTLSGSLLESESESLPDPNTLASLNLTGDGDGWNVAFASDRIFMINHHAWYKDGSATFAQKGWLHCYDKATGNACDGFSTNGTYASGTPGQALGEGEPDFATPMQSTLYVDEDRGRVWTMGTVLGDQNTPPNSGVVTYNDVVFRCIDYINQTSCGDVKTGHKAYVRTYWDNDDKPSSFPQVSLAGEFKGNLYGRIYCRPYSGVNGDCQKDGGQGWEAENKLVCVNLNDKDECGTNGTQIPKITRGEDGNNFMADTQIYSGKMVWVRGEKDGTGRGQILCWDLSGNSACTLDDYLLNGQAQGDGYWDTPWVTLLPIGPPGSATGVCAIESWGYKVLDKPPKGKFNKHAVNCQNFGGGRSSTTADALSSLLSGNYMTRPTYNDKATNSQVFIPIVCQGASDDCNLENSTYKFQCFDTVSLTDDCGKKESTTGSNLYPYSLSKDPYTGCVYENGDHGDVFAYNPVDGSDVCGAVSSKYFSVTPNEAYCDADAATGGAEKYDKVVVDGLPNDFNGSVEIKARASGGFYAIPGYANVPLSDDDNGRLAADISGIAVGDNVTIGGAQFNTSTLNVTVRAAGSTAPNSWDVKAAVTWTGDGPQLCVKTVVDDTCSVAMTGTVGNTATQNSVTKTASLTLAEDTDLCSYTVKKSTSPGSAAAGQTVSYTVTVTNTGSQPFTGITVTDDLEDVLDVATGPTINLPSGGTAAGNASFTSPNLTWSGIDLAAKDNAGDTATLTYDVVVNNPLAGDQQLENVVVSDRSTNCPDTTTANNTDDCHTNTGLASISYKKTVSPASGDLKPGDEVTFTVTATNSGTGPGSGKWTDDLTEVLKVADWQASDFQLVGPGAKKYENSIVSWNGELQAKGSTDNGGNATDVATVTYVVKVKADINGATTLNNKIVSTNGNCQSGSIDPDCGTSSNLSGPNITYSKSVVGSPSAVNPGDTVTYQVTATNTGNGSGAAAWTDDLTGVLVYADYNDDQQVTVGPGAATYSQPKVSWSGRLGAAGSDTATATVTYSVTVNSAADLLKLDNDTKLGANAVLANTIVTTDENCTDGSADANCSTSTPIALVQYRKAVLSPEDGDTVPGGTVQYQVTSTSKGAAPVAAKWTDNLTEVLAKATYDGNAAEANSLGTLQYVEPNLSWEGTLDAASGSNPVSTVTYSVTVLAAAALPSPPGSLSNGIITENGNCVAGSDDKSCDTSVGIGVIVYAKSITSVNGSPPGNPLSVKPGDTVTYQVTATNVSNVAAAGSFTDNLTNALKYAEYNNDEATDVGEVSFAADTKTVSWSDDDLAGVQTATITYSVKVKSAADLLKLDNETELGTNAKLDNTVVGPAGSNCPPNDPTPDPGCSTSTPIALVQYLKTADPADGDVSPGATVTYTVTSTSRGAAAVDADWTDDLTDVLDEANYNNDAAVTAGPAGTLDTSKVNAIPPTLGWSGTLDAVGGSNPVSTVTYSVTVKPATELANVDPGSLTNGITTTNGNCEDGSNDPSCNTSTEIAAIVYKKERVWPAGTVPAWPKGNVFYRVTATNVNDVTTSGTWSDDLTNVLVYAGYNYAKIEQDRPGDTLNYASSKLTWSGNLAAGASASVLYSVTVKSAADLLALDNDKLDGNAVLSNTIVTGDDSNCPLNDPDPDSDCSTSTPIALFEYAKTIVSPESSAGPGEQIKYQVVAKNRGASAFPARWFDDLNDVLQYAAYDDESAQVVEDNRTNDVVNYDATVPAITWEGTLGAAGSADDTATVQYTVTVNDSVPSEGVTAPNVVIGAFGNCPPDTDSLPEECDVDINLGAPAFTTTKRAISNGAAKPGDTVTYRIDVENTGTSAGTTSWTDNLDSDSADYVANSAVASSGKVSYDGSTLKWEGTLQPKAKARITYEMKVKPADQLPPGATLINTVISDDGNCVRRPLPAECSTITPIAAVKYAKVRTSPGGGSVSPNDKVGYQVTATSIGSAPVAATWADDLSDVLTYADYNDDAAVTTGPNGNLVYDKPKLSWSGTLQPYNTANSVSTVTYSVTVKSGAELLELDDSQLGSNAVLDNGISVGAGGDCPAGCSTSVPLLLLHHEKSVLREPKPAERGDTRQYQIVTTNRGAATANPASWTDNLSDVLLAADYNGDATTDFGRVTYAEPKLSWSSDEPFGPDATATTSYSVTVTSVPDKAGGWLQNSVVGPDSNCPAESTPLLQAPPGVQLPTLAELLEGKPIQQPSAVIDPDCYAVVPLYDVVVKKTVDDDSPAAPGDDRMYTISVTNFAKRPVRPVLKDNLSDVIDSASVKPKQAKESQGKLKWDKPKLFWSVGKLKPGNTATLDLELTISDNPEPGKIRNSVVMVPPKSDKPKDPEVEVEESNCPPGSDNPDCFAPVVAVEVDKTPVKVKNKKKKGKNCKKQKIATVKTEPKAKVTAKIQKCVVGGKQLSGSACGRLWAKPARANRKGKSSIYLTPEAKGTFTIKVSANAKSMVKSSKTFKVKINKGSKVCTLPGTG
jgi:fimbrial isopeptide formation D2 family protein/uncharacterized repeat protein (TIGR01451 family)